MAKSTTTAGMKSKLSKLRRTVDDREATDIQEEPTGSRSREKASILLRKTSFIKGKMKLLRSKNAISWGQTAVSRSKTKLRRGETAFTVGTTTITHGDTTSSLSKATLSQGKKSVTVVKTFLKRGKDTQWNLYWDFHLWLKYIYQTNRLRNKERSCKWVDVWDASVSSKGYRISCYCILNQVEVFYEICVPELEYGWKVGADLKKNIPLCDEGNQPEMQILRSWVYSWFEASVCMLGVLAGFQ